MADHFTLKFNTPIEQAIARADPNNVHKAISRTVRDLANMAKTAAFRNVAKEFVLTQKMAKSKLVVPNPRARSIRKGIVHVGLVDFAGRRISLMHFKPKERPVMSRIGIRKAVSIKVRRKGQRRTARHDSEFAGFMGAGRAGLTDGAGAVQLFRRFKKPVHRSRKDRLPAKKMDTKAPSMMLMSSLAQEAMDKRVQQQFFPVMSRHLNFYQNLAGRRVI